MSRLLLIPTEIESRELLDLCRRISVPGHAEHPVFSGWRIEHCGLGVVAAAARSAALIECIRPSRIVLAGFSQGCAMALMVGLRHPERLAGVMSSFRPGGAVPGDHLSYSPWCVPNTLEGKKCVIVHIDMRDDNVMAWDFVMGFARDNQLQVIQTQQP